ncbi:multimeric flavodoxin WrbA [Clostridium pascui]|uniref:flavodoxin family protein n=1 Tax=Clostridium pascui TaxID=46609 RepID=UPI00195ADA3F|nr:flavodoxin family protein [Clostridium pascui]MBM7871260.1 multimeric flavodoxin WrbA [Clostridium pascui]
MRVLVIYGTQRKGSTYHITQRFLEKLCDGENDIKEFFLPKDSPNFCRGCFQCFTDNAKCPDYQYIKRILESMQEAELIIFTSPVYVYHVTGQMKAFLDHFGFQWMAHQPNETMFRKQALIISTAAGAGTKSTMKDIVDSFNFWGVARIHKYGVNVAAIDWDQVSNKKKIQIQNKVEKLAVKIKGKSKKVTPSLKVKGLFYIMRFMQRKFRFNEPDVKHWESHGWLGKKRPWKD